MADLDSNNPAGTLDFFILQKLSHEPLQATELERRTERIRMMLEFGAQRKGKASPGTLSTALRRLEREGWVQVDNESTNATLEPSYSLTPSGRDQLQTQQANWTSLLNGFIDDERFDDSFRRFLNRDL